MGSKYDELWIEIIAELRTAMERASKGDEPYLV